jgi:hypothetical protein
MAWLGLCGSWSVELAPGRTLEADLETFERRERLRASVYFLLPSGMAWEFKNEPGTPVWSWRHVDDQTGETIATSSAALTLTHCFYDARSHGFVGSRVPIEAPKEQDELSGSAGCP